jgi:hypothetical protein
MTLRKALLMIPLLLAVGACGSGSESGDDDGNGAGADGGNGGGGGGGDTPQCSDGIDNDGDGYVDGFDPECTGPLDDREDSFATGIPGDNIDAVKQDCFFDGDSGHGNDGCLLHTCCLLEGECPEELRPEQFDPDDCTPSQDCIDFCAPLTPPGCDCFGCCTICQGDTCRDVLTNPAVAPDCTLDTITDEVLCPSCIKVDDCGPPGDDCADLECNLCPGQTPEDLPPECEEPECPGDLDTCASDDDCGDGRYCSFGCCINIIT